MRLPIVTLYSVKWLDAYDAKEFDGGKPGWRMIVAKAVKGQRYKLLENRQYFHFSTFIYFNSKSVAEDPVIALENAIKASADSVKHHAEAYLEAKKKYHAILRFKPK